MTEQLPLRWRYLVTDVWGSMVGRLNVGEEVIERVWKSSGTATWDIYNSTEHKVTGGWSGRYLGRYTPPETTAPTGMTTAAVLRFDIKLPRLGYSLNARVHWSERARVNKMLKDLAWGYAHEAFLRHRQRWSVIEWPRSQIKRSVQFHVIWPRDRKGPMPDTDNLGLKAVLDGIAQALLVDDSPKWCDYRKPTQEKGSHTGYVLVRAEVGPA